MKPQKQLFLEALKASLTNTTVTWTTPLSNEEWQSIFELAESHKVLPLIFHAVYSCPAAASLDARMLLFLKHRTLTLTLNQVQRTAEFLKLYEKLAEEGITPLIIKGLICRELYPKPDLRISADEDILVQAEDFEKAIKILESCGMKLKEPMIEGNGEAALISEKGSTYIELHRQLFANGSKAYGELNAYFADCFESKVSLDVQGTTVYTMEPGLHLFYLFCHAFKHFLHGGFGIRQVCDIIMFANIYGKEIDWQKLLQQCKELRMEKFAAALFKIGKNYLVFDEEKAGFPVQWQTIAIDETDLLEDLLESGIYGSSTLSRKHSSHMTLDAVIESKQGKKSGNAVLKAVFLSAKDLEGRYPYLKEKPYLLPIAWTSRIIDYAKQTKSVKDSSAIEALKLGKDRIELLKKYGMIE